MKFNWLLPVRITQAVFTIITLGLLSFVAHWWTSHWNAVLPAEVSYTLFASVWTILSLVFLIVAPWRFPAAAHKFALLGVDGVTMAFWFASFITLVVWLDNRVCFGIVCNSARAATVFAALDWALFLATTASAAIHVVRSRNTSAKDPAPEMQGSEPAKS